MALKKAAKTAKSVAKKSISVKKPFTKSELVSTIVDVAGLAKKQVAAMMDTLSQIIEAHLNKKGPGMFVLPGLAKFRIVRKPATKARKGINPFTGEPTTFAAKPARNVVRIKALKKLKEIAK